MGRIWIWVAGVVAVVAVGGGVFYVVTRGDDGSTSNTVAQTGESADPGATKTACDVFTLDVAKQVLGEGAVKSPMPPGANTSTDSVSVTQCLYEVEDGSGLKVANLLVRGAKNEDAYSTNEFGFNSTRDGGGPEGGAESISGLGDDAYFNPGLGQVNVLVNEGQYWLIADADGDRQKAEALARAVAGNL